LWYSNLLAGAIAGGLKAIGLKKTPKSQKFVEKTSKSEKFNEKNVFELKNDSSKSQNCSFFFKIAKFASQG
jgi:hypothetical protein